MRFVNPGGCIVKTLKNPGTFTVSIRSTWNVFDRLLSNDDHSPIKVVNFNGVGGGTVFYTAHFPRLHPSDFRVRTLDGVAEDWPIDYATLEPFFTENDRMMGVSGLAGDPGSPPRDPPMPQLPL